MRVSTVRGDEIRSEGCRLTGGFHLSEDQIAVARLRKNAARSTELSALCNGRGIFRGPIFSRIYAKDGEHGEPYVSARDLVQSYVRPPSYLSRQHGSLLDELRLHQGMILLTCSGMNLGSAIWTRADMDGLCATHDLIRICVDGAKIAPGYVFAFLASRYGRGWVRKQIYGGNIKHVEPEHVARLPVPRFECALEQEVHRLVLKASEQRLLARHQHETAVGAVQEAVEWERPSNDRRFAVARLSHLQRRLDAFHHSSEVAAARHCLGRIESVPVGEVVDEVFEPGRSARHKVDDPAFGVPFLSSSEVFKLDPTADYLVSTKKTSNLDRLLVQDRDVLIPRSGQVGGIIGRAVLPLGSYVGDAASEHLVRVRCRSVSDARYVWSVLASEPGYHAVVGTAYGSSIPSLDCELIGELRIPWFEEVERNTIAAAAGRMTDALDCAIAAEREAVGLIEQAIEEAS